MAAPMAPARRTASTPTATAAKGRRKTAKKRGASARPRASRSARDANALATLAVHRVEVALKPEQIDPAGRAALADLVAAGVTGLNDVRVTRVYFLEGALSADDLRHAAREVLADPVMDRFSVRASLSGVGAPGARAISVMRKPGVTDPEADSAAATLRALGLAVRRVKTGRIYWIAGAAAALAAGTGSGSSRGRPGDPLLLAAGRSLGNAVIED